MTTIKDIITTTIRSILLTATGRIGTGEMGHGATSGQAEVGTKALYSFCVCSIALGGQARLSFLPRVEDKGKGSESAQYVTVRDVVLCSIVVACTDSGRRLRAPRH